MEKNTPHYKLKRVFELLDQDGVRATFSALADAAALDIDFAGMVAVVRQLGKEDFL
jgi:hypothetical protein